MLWQQWWVWLTAAAVLGIAEVFMPGFVLLGFGVGAVVVGILLWLGLLGGSLPVLILVFAVASLIAWVLLRRIAGVRKGQVKVWDTDINEP
ncbi:hypothetical protein [Ostreiculturibacter nitratireducens]|uniref:NfeD family protein n=1 Tax=Ostreiculturibacter nitratireducens TaxID=3075226 RepID=UPI0031B5A78D